MIRLILRDTTVKMCFLIIVVSLSLMRWGEQIPNNNGLGFDGLRYAAIVRDPGYLKAQDSYLVQRSLPSLIVRWGLVTMGQELVPPRIVAGFTVFNFCLLLVATVLWGRLSKRLGLSTTLCWFGFVGLFINPGVLKLAFYYPTLTDNTAFVLGLAAVYSYLVRSWIGMLIVMLISCFAWPALVYFAALLFVFPPTSAMPVRVPYKLSILAAVAGGLISVGAIVAIVYETIPANYVGKIYKFSRFRAVDLRFLHLSTFCVFAYIVAACIPLLRNQQVLSAQFFRQFPWRTMLVRAVTVGVMMAAWANIVHRIAPAPASVTANSLFTGSIQLSVGKPFIFLVSHLAYFGPFLLLTIFFWPSICRIVQEQGVGLNLYVLCMIGLSLNSEARLLITFLPLVVAITCMALNRLSVPRGVLVFLVVLSVINSRLLVLYNRNFEELYFMPLGPWMSEFGYCLQGLAALVVGGVLLLLLFPNVIRSEKVDSLPDRFYSPPNLLRKEIE